ncbi:hypothetical protein H4W31_005089 [Plantactinospora soyae]|uniref:Uncharacterized protein n=1 Tax=Plantactinospora soyae TaxID=1544732 RepID=A0A927R958_9ACTN|nr:hypothetical protein [Plantactinospora soyae]
MAPVRWSEMLKAKGRSTRNTVRPSPAEVLITPPETAAASVPRSSTRR